MNECSKTIYRRLSNPNFIINYFRGNGLDVGAGSDSLANYIYLFPAIDSIRSWDIADGDAEKLDTIAENSFDFVHSSHCLEHLKNPLTGLFHWFRVTKLNGYIIVTVPDEDLYEQGQFPSTWSQEHLWSFTIYKKKSWSPKSISIINFLSLLDEELDARNVGYTFRIEKIELLNYTFDRNIARTDQTLTSKITESCIEFILQKVAI